MYPKAKLETLLLQYKIPKIKLILPDDSFCLHSWHGPDKPITVYIRQWQIIDFFIKGDANALIESYINQIWHTDQLYMLMLSILNSSFCHLRFSKSILSGVSTYYGNIISSLANFNTDPSLLKQSLSNPDFSMQWLDSSMSNSAAIFADNPSDPLHLAHRRKYMRVLSQIESTCTHEILDLNPSWGAFVEFSLQHNFNISAYCTSDAQIEFIKRRLGNHNYIADYRLLYSDQEAKDMQYDAVISLEHLQYLPHQHWDIYFKKIHKSLRNQGRLLLQTLSVDPSFLSMNIIYNHFFPDAKIPCSEELGQLFSKYYFETEACYAFSDNYTRTLKAWLLNFQSRQQHLLDLGIEKNTIRSWVFFLSLAYACCSRGLVKVNQFTLVKKPS